MVMDSPHPNCKGPDHRGHAFCFYREVGIAGQVSLAPVYMAFFCAVFHLVIVSELQCGYV